MIGQAQDSAHEEVAYGEMAEEGTISILHGRAGTSVEIEDPTTFEILALLVVAVTVLLIAAVWVRRVRPDAMG